ncbi:MAG: alpha/beta fold hydrolase [Caldilineaceae bacterium]
MQTGYIEQADGKLYYEMDGESNEEVLVLSHAAFLDSGMWDAQWSEFSRHYRVIRYDMRGYGQSDPVTGPRVRRHDLRMLLQQLAVENAHLLGCSMGGEIVLDLALEQPELVRSLIIVNGPPSGFEPQGEPPAHLFDMLGAMQQGNLDLASELQLRIWFDGPQRTPPPVNQAMRQRAAAMNRIFVANNTWAIADMQPLNPLRPPAVGRLSEIQVPTLVVKGELDHAENLRASDLLASGIPHAQVASIANGAHVPNMDEPAVFNEIVLRFLAAL